MQILYAKYRIVTPLFIGSADKSVSDGIRPPSIKGLLRFWWRALHWGHFWQENLSETDVLKALHQEEQRLFGAAMDSKNNTGGQGCFLLSVTQIKSTKPPIKDWPPNSANHGASYLAYGLLETSKEFHRKALLEQQDFCLKLLFNPNNKKIEQDMQMMQKVLTTWSLLGGLGSRSRRAMGSISLVELESTSMLLNKQQYDVAIKELFAPFRSIPIAPFTALSQESAYRIVSTGTNARSLVEKIGQSYKDFRKKEPRKDRVPFGLPLKEEDEINRRASPLFFHIHALKQNNFASSLFFLPSTPFHYHANYHRQSLHIVKNYLVKGAH